MQQWLASHPYVSYLLIFVFIVYIFNKVFRVQKLPILKEIIIYLFMALGAFVLLIFQIDKLPIVQCLFVAVALMFMVRIRYFVEARRKKTTDQQN
ncbi:YlaH-like family protein [Paenibacillus apiarius]|uniref:YlaH-like family protein n=1 Tax=Paenibacillus apiarius TaxID=46240 RepID=A0ABT4DPR3_9BACL|nr:YlaH-like family protein [Paenibacillus apiarius]MBN3525937.1 YlaH-like family protein [Paenibacillus apiarius]MCY9513562.1 YlaH-like family protein [Paenibacillus apiarius]MCY9518113.1 YlaH-like family protein [Paenibacillus apiarius]MCY9551486.1 YlaH-like family protein [Paenibacillus apiarius]MCY9558640.1 YlaH-like family protein [Paenibacillus apiarius]